MEIIISRSSRLSSCIAKDAWSTISIEVLFGISHPDRFLDQFTQSEKEDQLDRDGILKFVHHKDQNPLAEGRSEGLVVTGQMIKLGFQA